MCSLLSVWNYVPMRAGAWGAQRLHQIPQHGVTGCCEPAGMGAANLTRVLSSSMYP